jgi:ribosomal protein S18 acetylase RimI-like enzyme
VRARRSGAGRALLDAARAYGEAHGAVRLTLSTQVENTTAQSLYEAAGWQRDSAFFVYNLALA